MLEARNDEKREKDVEEMKSLGVMAISSLWKEESEEVNAIIMQKSL